MVTVAVDCLALEHLDVLLAAAVDHCHHLNSDWPLGWDSVDYCMWPQHLMVVPHSVVVEDQDLDSMIVDSVDIRLAVGIVAVAADMPVGRVAPGSYPGRRVVRSVAGHSQDSDLDLVYRIRSPLAVVVVRSHSVEDIDLVLGHRPVVHTFVVGHPGDRVVADKHPVMDLVDVAVRHSDSQRLVVERLTLLVAYGDILEDHRHWLDNLNIMK